MTTPQQVLLRRRLQTLHDRTNTEIAVAEAVKQDNDWLADVTASINGIIRKMR